MRYVLTTVILGIALFNTSCGKNTGNSVEAFLGDWHRPLEYDTPIGTDLLSITISIPQTSNRKAHDSDRRENIKNVVATNNMSMRGAVFVTVDYNYVDPEKTERQGLGVFLSEANIVLAESLPPLGLRPEHNAILVGITLWYKQAEDAAEHSSSSTDYPIDRP